MQQAVGLLELASHRLVPPEQVHLTLHFIGQTPASELDQTIESVRRATAGVHGFALRPLGLIRLPQRGPARLVAAETDRPPALLEIKRRLVTRLARSSRRDSADRFRPHLTLCRFRKPTRVDAIEAPFDVAAFPVTRIALMRSTLTHHGAEHHEVISCEMEKD